MRSWASRLVLWLKARLQRPQRKASPASGSTGARAGLRPGRTPLPHVAQTCLLWWSRKRDKYRKAWEHGSQEYSFRMVPKASAHGLPGLLPGLLLGLLLDLLQGLLLGRLFLGGRGSRTGCSGAAWTLPGHGTLCRARAALSLEDDHGGGRWSSLESCHHVHLHLLVLLAGMCLGESGRVPLGEHCGGWC